MSLFFIVLVFGIVLWPFFAELLNTNFLQFGAFKPGLWQEHQYINITGAASIFNLVPPKPCVTRHPENNSLRVLVVGKGMTICARFIGGRLHRGVRIAFFTFAYDTSTPVSNSAGVLGVAQGKTVHSTFVRTNKDYSCALADISDVEGFSMWAASDRALWVLDEILWEA